MELSVHKVNSILLLGGFSFLLSYLDVKLFLAYLVFVIIGFVFEALRESRE